MVDRVIGRLYVNLDGMAAVSQSELMNVIDNILRLDDTNDNGTIEYSEFVLAMRRYRQR